MVDDFDHDAFLRSGSFQSRPQAQQSAGMPQHQPGEDDEKGPRLFSEEHVYWLREIAEQLMRRRHITNVVFDLPQHAPQILMETFESGLGVTLPPAIRSFYSHIDGFHFRWDYVDNEGVERHGGEVQIFDFSTVFDSWLDRIWRLDESLATERQDFLWELRGLDHQPTFRPQDMTVFHMPEDDPGFELYLHRPEHSFALELDFLTYIEAAIECRGILGWQQLFCSDYDLQADPFEFGGIDSVYELLDRFFPEANISAFYTMPALSSLADDEEE